jgi:hypothetical protein
LLIIRRSNCINPLNAELIPMCHLLILLGDLTFMGKCIVSISNKMQRYTVNFIWNLLNMFRVVLLPIIRSAYNFIYSIWYLSQWFECAVGGVRHPQHTQTCSNSSTIAADSSKRVTNSRCYKYSLMRS